MRTGDRLDFNSLQQWMATGRKLLPAFVRERPASFAAFDVLAVVGHDIRDLALKDRRVLLEELAAGWDPPLNLTPVTTDYSTALEWFEDFPPTGIEGLVVKGAGQKYEGGVRQWLKVKHRDNLDVSASTVRIPVNPGFTRLVSDARHEWPSSTTGTAALNCQSSSARPRKADQRGRTRDRGGRMGRRSIPGPSSGVRPS
jgi:hypothetical protein